MLSPGNGRHLFISAMIHQPRCFSGPEDINGRNKWGQRHDADVWPVSLDQFIFFDNKIQSISQRDTGINMLLNPPFIAERRIIKSESIMLL